MKRLAAMGACRLSYYLLQHGGIAQIEKYKGILGTNITGSEYKELEEGYLLELAEEESPVGHVFRLVVDQLDGSEIDSNYANPESAIALTCVELGLLLYMNESMGDLYHTLYPKGKDKVTVGLASKILYGDEYCMDHPIVIKKAYDKVELLCQATYPTMDMLGTALLVDDRLVNYLGGGQDLSLIGTPFVSVYPIANEHMVSQDEVFREAELMNTVKQLKLFAEQSSQLQTIIVTAIGEEMSGRKFFMKQVAKENNYELIMVPLHVLGSTEHILKNLRKVLREVLLTKQSLCITGISWNEQMETILPMILREYEEVLIRAFHRGVGLEPAKRPLFLTGDEKMKVSSYMDRVVCQAECKQPDMTMSARAWDFFSEKYIGEKVLNSRELAVKMKISYGKIEQIVRRLVCAPVENPYDSKYVFKCCYELLDDGRYDNIKRVEAKYTYDDLKLDEAQKSIIRDICNQVEYRRMVMDDWNLKSRYSYGTCVSALFTGPPGTGKTMAVHVMAGILGLELYKVNVSQLVDKYIGETEKRLEEVFQRAEKSNMILFFDEADSIIGKRSEVKEANDKYANTEVSYLLQRIEEYDGIVILASNYSQNIDSAIIRRIRYTVHFALPDEDTRREIWKSAFSKEVATEDIDFDYLAKQFEFSGGQIKNIVLNAVFLAAAEGRAVSMRHMVRAISLDMVKDKNVSFVAELGEYAYLA